MPESKNEIGYVSKKHEIFIGIKYFRKYVFLNISHNLMFLITTLIITLHHIHTHMSQHDPEWRRPSARRRKKFPS